MTSLACINSVKRTNGGRPKVKNTHIVFCIDKSSSMTQFSAKNMLDSINKLINEQKKNCNILVKNYITIIKFGSDVSSVYERNDIIKFGSLSYGDITPGGTTSLYDAIGIGLGKLKSDEENMFMILTDGYENTSSIETIDTVNQKVKKAIGDKYLVKYLGGGSDAITIGLQMGFPENCCLTFTNCDSGFKNAINSLSCSLSRHRSSGNHAFTGLERVQSVVKSTGLKRVLRRTNLFNLLV